MIEIVRKGNAVSRLTVNKDRTTIKLAVKDDNPKTIEFFLDTADAIRKDSRIQVTMRGMLEGADIVMEDDRRSLKYKYSSQ